MKKYLLSTGESTTKIEKYILDLFRLYINIWPSDIPGRSDIGFDFILTDTKKDELANEVRSRVRDLVNKIEKKFSSTRNLEIQIKGIDIIDEERAKVIIDVNDYGEEIEVNLYEK